jgi:hypothetical protein
MKTERTERSETLAYKLQASANHPEESVQRSEYGESFKSRIYIIYFSELACRLCGCHEQGWTNVCASETSMCAVGETSVLDMFCFLCERLIYN